MAIVATLPFLLAWVLPANHPEAGIPSCGHVLDSRLRGSDAPPDLEGQGDREESAPSPARE